MLRSVIWGAALFSVLSAGAHALPANNNELVKTFTRAQQLGAEGKFDEAISIYQGLIKSHPLLPEAYNNLAALYLKQKNTRQARFVLEQGLHAHKGYGVLYESLTAINVAMARQAYSKALQIDVKPADISIATLSLEEESLKGKNQPIVISKERASDKKPVEVEPAKSNQARENEKEKEVIAAITSGAIKREAVTSPLKPVVVTSAKSVESPETVLQAWSTAWSAQAVDVYLSFYHEHYKPVNGMARKNWEQSRRFRLKKPRWIQVSLSDFNVVKNTGKQAVISFKQVYRSNSFHDVSDKQMVLIYTDDGWRIYREKSL
ncbi:MAG: tetratricopeptide repeat protein [Gammaproteobacteria bacterium]|nr:tetratricopeptide repeat protein [Gammaproteobacteria bacterium]